MQTPPPPQKGGGGYGKHDLTVVELYVYIHICPPPWKIFCRRFCLRHYHSMKRKVLLYAIKC